jgi:hypothetical protein
MMFSMQNKTQTSLVVMISSEVARCQILFGQMIFVQTIISIKLNSVKRFVSEMSQTPLMETIFDIIILPHSYVNKKNISYKTLKHHKHGGFTFIIINFMKMLVKQCDLSSLKITFCRDKKKIVDDLVTFLHY